MMRYTFPLCAMMGVLLACTPSFAQSIYPINLPTALKLAGANPLDIALAEQRVQAAIAQRDRADVLWLPSISIGVDYARHDGQIQDIRGRVFTTSRGSFMVGAGPNLVFALTDAIYAPLATQQLVQARTAEVQTARNDATLAVAEAFFTVQQARGELTGAAEAARRAEELLRRVEKLAPGLVPTVEIQRAKTELARRKLTIETAQERWQVSSAELARILRLPPAALVDPTEPPHIKVELINDRQSVDELIPLGLTYRPELAAHQAFVQMTLTRMQQERMRPLIPSLLLRGNAVNPSTALSTGLFGGGINDSMTNFGARNSLDVQVLWEFQNLGLGNRALVREREAENRQATLELFRMQDRVAAEVVQAFAQTQRAMNRILIAEEGLQYAVESADKNLAGLAQTKRDGELVTLVLRPQEVVAAISALDQAYRDYYSAIADRNRSQFRLYRAIGHPAACLQQLQPKESPPSPQPAP